MIIPFFLKKAMSLYGDKEAVVSSGKRFTYRQFGDRIYRFAGFLRNLGIRRGDRIAVLHQNGHEFLEAYFAAAQLGAVLNPLNFRLSSNEMAFILKDSGSTVLLVSNRFREAVASLTGFDTDIRQVIWTGGAEPPCSFEAFDYEAALQEGHPRFSAWPEITDEDLAHLYYTSGTTGRPKGVMLSHKNVCTHSLAAVAELKLGDHDNWIHVAPLFHLADAWATFAVTLVGGKHILVPDFEPAEVLSSIQDEKVTITNMIPTMLNILVNTPGVEQHDFSSLRAILSGGSSIAPEVVKKIMDVFGCDYIQTYGMTETSPYLTVSILKENLLGLPREEKFFYKAKTGRPFIGVLLRVVRENGTGVAADDKEVGEIIVKGDIVTKGYWNRPEETAKAFKDGWLYTGDMAVLDSEGYVNIVDRKKDMIITGGENVYSVEVENILYTHDAVLEAAVIGVPDSKWGEAVKAFIVLKQGRSTTEAEIIQHCKESIAGYKAPKSVDFVAELPKTGSGKISKKTLKESYN